MTQAKIQEPPTQTVAEPKKPFPDRFFELTARQSTFGREVRGGVTTFVAMAYIVLLNPLILGASADITGARLTAGQVTTATALSAAVMTVLMGLIGNAPLALAAGLGVNGIVAFQMAPAMTWAQAFGLVVLEGVCIVLMAVSGDDTGQAYVCQAGREPVAFEFRGVPGPRAAGAQGRRPPPGMGEV